MGKDQFRFYDLAEMFDDDERIIAFAITDFCETDLTPEDIYKDLLSCHYRKYNDMIESVLFKLTIEELSDYIGRKQFELDMLNSHLWSCGDTAMIEKAGWKLNNEREE